MFYNVDSNFYSQDKYNTVAPRHTKTPLYEKFTLQNGLRRNFCPI